MKPTTCECQPINPTLHYVLRMEDSHVLTMALQLEFEDQWNEGRLKMTWMT